MSARKCHGTRVRFPAPPLSDTPCGNAGRVSFWTYVETRPPQGLTTGSSCRITCLISPPFVSDKPVPTTLLVGATVPTSRPPDTGYAPVVARPNVARPKRSTLPTGGYRMSRKRDLQPDEQGHGAVV